MYRIIKMQNKAYALKIRSIEDDIEDIESFIESGDVVMISENLESVAEILGIKESEIEITERY